MNWVTDLNDFQKLKTADGKQWAGGESMYRKDLPPGSVQWSVRSDGKERHLWLTCPCGCGLATLIHIKNAEYSYGWAWDGNETLPTLTPSIKITTPCQWHGYLRRGLWENA